VLHVLDVQPVFINRQRRLRRCRDIKCMSIDLNPPCIWIEVPKVEQFPALKACLFLNSRRAASSGVFSGVHSTRRKLPREFFNAGTKLSDDRN